MDNTLFTDTIKLAYPSELQLYTSNMSDQDVFFLELHLEVKMVN